MSFAQSFGPAWIAMIADVDAPSILTAATVGAVYGYGLIWFFLLLTVPLFIIQETSGRIGIATGKGLGDLIRASYSRRVALLAALPMATVDVVSYVAEYAGIAIGMELVGSPACGLDAGGLRRAHPDHKEEEIRLDPEGTRCHLCGSDYLVRRVSLRPGTHFLQSARVQR